MTVDRPIRIVIAGGGTGGHVQPAVSVIEVLQSRGVAVEYLWIGSGQLEELAAEQNSCRFTRVQSGKMRRYKDPKNVADLFRVPVGIAQAYRELRAFRPDVIFSTGGYVSTPTVIAGGRIAPILTHEQTTTIGLATSINAFFADVLALSYDQSRDRAARLKPRIALTGNPVRKSLIGGNANRGFARFGFDQNVPLLYVTGGANGSTPLNVRIEAELDDLLDICQILHQTGPASANDDGRRLRAWREALPAETQRRYVVVERVGEEIADVFAAASLVLSRAGAGTVAELAFLGKPAILVPLPGSGGSEQELNARVLGDAGAAIVIPQTEASAERLRTEVVRLFGDPKLLEEMSVRAFTVGRPNAADLLADELLALIRR